MMKQFTIRPRQIRRNFAQWLRFAPTSNHLGYDIFHLLLLFSLQTTIFAKIFPLPASIDLITPWLTIVFVYQSLRNSIVLLIIAGLLTELHTAAPAGMYLCSYWVCGSVIHLCRQAISWQHRTSWVITFFLVGCVISTFEALSFSSTTELGEFSWGYISTEIFKVFMTVFIGMTAREWFMYKGWLNKADT